MTTLYRSATASLHSSARSAVACAILTVFTGGCGVQGDQGAATFLVESSWTPSTPIALASTIAVSASRKDLLKTALAVEAEPATVMAKKGAGFQAVGTGNVTFRAVDPASQALIDTVSYEVAKTETAGLSYGPDRVLDPKNRVAAAFTIVAGANVDLLPELADKQGRQLNHKGIVTLQAEGGASVAAKSASYTVSAAAAGVGKVTLAVAGVDGKPAISDVHVVTAVALTDVAAVDLQAMTVLADLSASDQTKPGVATPPGQAEPAPADKVVFVVAQAKDAAGQRIYGAVGNWSVTAGTAKLFFTKPGDVQYLVLKPGEKVTIQVEITGKIATKAIEG